MKIAEKKRQMLTEEQILNIQQKMEEAKNKPVEKRVYTKKETVLRLKKHILEMQKKGYTLDDIRLFFEKNGLVISLSSLKSYMGTRKAKKTDAPVPQDEAEKKIKKDTKADTNKAEVPTIDKGEHAEKKPLPTAVNDTKTMTMEQPKPDGSFKVTPDRPEY